MLPLGGPGRDYEYTGATGELFTLLFKHASGESLILDDKLPLASGEIVVAGASLLPSLNQKPGILLLTQNVLRQTEIIPNPSEDGEIQLPYWHTLSDTVLLYQGQQLRGTGSGRRTGGPSEVFTNLAAPYSDIPSIKVDPGVDPAIKVAAGHDRVMVAHLDILRPIGAAGVGIDLGMSNHCRIQFVSIQEFKVGVRIGGRSNWVESGRLSCDRPVECLPSSFSTTLWAIHCNSGSALAGDQLELDGVANHLYFSAVEPETIQNPGDPNEPDAHQIKISGLGNGVFCGHVEGKLDPESIGTPDTVISIEDNSDACFVDGVAFNLEAFTAVVKRGASTSMVRTLPSSSGGIQLPVNAGLENLLFDAAFVDTAQNWNVPAGTSTTRQLNNDVGLATEFDFTGVAPTLFKVPLLEQGIKPNSYPGLISVADRTFAAGVRVYSKKALVLRLIDDKGREATSNPAKPSTWTLLSVTLHSSKFAKSVKFQLFGFPNGEHIVAQPQLVQGIYLPPFALRALSDTDPKFVETPWQVGIRLPKFEWAEISSASTNDPWKHRFRSPVAARLTGVVLRALTVKKDVTFEVQITIEPLNDPAIDVFSSPRRLHTTADGPWAHDLEFDRPVEVPKHAVIRVSASLYKDNSGTSALPAETFSAQLELRGA